MTRPIAALALTLPLVLATAPPAVAQKALNDTGVDICYDDSNSTGTNEPVTHPRQDCRLGRDAANAVATLYKVGGGSKGFDFAKIANNGTGLPAGASLGTNPTDWACTLDNVTGLMWEVKTATPATLRYAGHSYSWYSTDPTSNGGDPGSADGHACGGTLPGNLCNTTAYTTAVNAGPGLCNHTDWRLPTAQELKTLVDYSQPYASGLPAVDGSYFPNTRQDDPYWTSVSYAANPANATYVYFNGGYTVAFDKYDWHYVLLVRIGP
ncbi:MAG: DUF1566 domain-containing protein [Casimicrobiaceae bacterium]